MLSFFPTLCGRANLEGLAAFGWRQGGGGGQGITDDSVSREGGNDVFHHPGYIADGLVDLGVRSQV